MAKVRRMGSEISIFFVSAALRPIIFLGPVWYTIMQNFP